VEPKPKKFGQPFPPFPPFPPLEKVEPKPKKFGQHFQNPKNLVNISKTGFLAQPFPKRLNKGLKNILSYTIIFFTIVYVKNYTKSYPKPNSNKQNFNTTTKKIR